MSDPKVGGRVRDRLLALLVERSVSRKKVVLASGKESDFFVDCKQTVLLAEGHALVGEAMLAEVAEVAALGDVQAVAGVALGGCPLASAVALTSYRKGTPLDAIYVRKATKSHGSGRRIEGDTHLSEGASIVVLEDVVTTGASTLEAVRQLRDAGYRVAGVVALVDRQEGGAETLDAADIRFRALYRRKDLADA